MTVHWYDLGQRLRAAHTGTPIARLRSAPLSVPTRPVAVRASSIDGHVECTATTPGESTATARGPEVLSMLGALGVRLDAETPATLVTDRTGTLPLLTRLARAVESDSEHEPVAAHIGWWADRADFPGGTAVADVISGCQRRWVLGTPPAAESDPATWRRWLGISDDSLDGLLELHRTLTAGPPLRFLDVLAEDDQSSFDYAQTALNDGYDWRRPDSTSRAALGLRARCDAADLYEAAVFSDPLGCRRAVHTGHVVTGTVVATTGRSMVVESPRLDARLRPGNAVTGWEGDPTRPDSPRFNGTIDRAEVAAGLLRLHVTGSTRNRPGDGAPVVLTAEPPVPQRQRAGRGNLRRLYSRRASWLSTGRPPTPTRRPVPLDVLVAGAEPDHADR